MAVIREELVLVDRFSAVFSKYLNMGRTASGAMQAAANSQNAFTEAAIQSSAALEEMAGTGSRAAEAVKRSETPPGRWLAPLVMPPTGRTSSTAPCAAGPRRRTA